MAEKKPKKPALVDHAGIALDFYKNAYDGDLGRRLLFNNGDFWWWHNPHWELQEPQGVKTQLWGYLSPRKPEVKHVNGALDALKAVAFEPASSRAPCWLRQWDGQPNAKDIIACNNGLLDIRSRDFLDLTPDFFNTSYLAIDYQDIYDPPQEWKRFLASLWPDDEESILCLQEIFGYLLTQDTSQHKIFMLIGPKRSGKSTIARILTALIGAGNVCNPTLSGLVSTAYGLECMIGTQLALIGDARIGPRADQQSIAETLLGVSGEDSQTIQRKYRTPWTGRLNTRFMILTNEVPSLSDASGALASRLIALETTESFFGREDLGLERRLMDELHGILHWSLKGLDRLRARGYFVQPQSGRDLMDELTRSASPMAQFVEDKCEVNGLHTIECSALFGYWKEWCEAQNRKPGTVQTFGRLLKAACPSVRTVQPRTENSGRDRYFEGIRPIN